MIPKQGRTTIMFLYDDFAMVRGRHNFEVVVDILKDGEAASPRRESSFLN